MTIWQDGWLFARQVVGQWTALITSSFPTALLFLLQNRRPDLVSKKTVIFFFVWFYFVVAAFLAWRGERVVRPGIEVQYDPVIRADQDWHMTADDLNNPGTSCKVEIVRGNLRVTLKNRRDKDVTVLPRTIRIEASECPFMPLTQQRAQAPNGPNVPELQ